jgi:hypothetical protein
MTRTRLTKGSTSSKSSAFARLGEARARKGYAKTDPSRRINEEPESVFAPSATKMQKTRNKMPVGSVYKVENKLFLNFLLRIRG